MKITYPECQIEISVEEVIALIDHANLKEPHRPTDPLRQRFPTEKIDELLGTKPGMIDDDFDPMLPTMKVLKAPETPKEVYEPEPTNMAGLQFKVGRVPYKRTEFSTAPLDGASFDETAPQKKPECSRKPKRIDVLTEEGWQTFDSQGKAAKFLGVAPSWLSKSLELGKTCNGHHVRYTPNPELDACLAEVEESNKKPYEPSRKP